MNDVITTNNIRPAVKPAPGRLSTITTNEVKPAAARYPRPGERKPAADPIIMGQAKPAAGQTAKKAPPAKDKKR